MKNICLKISLLFFSLLLVLAVPTAYAASLGLTSIGALNTSGNQYSEWWYTGTSPMLRGTAGENDTVTITIDDSSSEVTADASGNWSYQSSLTQGDYAVTLASGGETYAFTLHVGQNVPADASSGTTETTQSTTSVPATGYPQVAGLAISLTLLSVGLYYFIQARRNSKKAYVKSVIDSVS